MRLRQLVLACGLTSLVLSPYVSALGLGEVKLKSTLNQPLEAEVKLLDTRDLTAEQILVSLASPADFERNGVDRLFFYTEFQFQVDLQSADGPKVMITSRSPVREPYLNFLVEARWTAGRLLREYTLLMDLPTFDEDASPRAVQSATTSVSAPQQRSVTSSNKASSGSGYSGAARQASLSGNEYEVRNNDTLWDIALRARPDAGVSVHQSMMALYRANPEAFINGNINRLRRGQVLRIPDANEMKSLSRSEAVSQFALATGDSDTGAQLNASRRVSSTRTESGDVSGRVKLAAPAAAAVGAGQGSGANDGAGKALEAELAVTLEELDKSKAENTELSSRVKDLEAQIQTMERLVEVSNEKLRALQVGAEQAAVSQTAPSPEAAPVADVESTANEVADVASSEASVSSVAAVAPPQPTPPKKVVVPPKPEPTLVDKAIENAPWIGLGVLGLAGAGYLAYRRRKQAEGQNDDEQDDIFAMDDSVNDADNPPSDADNFEGIEESSLFEEETETTAVAETGDVVGEADIYIAYGKLDQAEEMLLNALQKDPNSTDIRMKLLEVYAQQQNGSAFDSHYAVLLPIAGAALLARASELRESISGAGVFNPVATGEDSSHATESESFSFDDLDLGAEEATEVAAVENEAANFDFDLDLNLDDDVDNLSSSVDSVRSEIDDDFTLDLDDDLAVENEPDDLSELSLALDGLEDQALPADLDVKATSIEDEFSFDLEDELELSDLGVEASTDLADDRAESLDVAADDFNLDMNVDDVDLAALDHEMESLDVDFDDSLLAGSEAADSPALENVSLDLGDDLSFDDLDLSSAEAELGEISTSNLNLTDSLDKSDTSMSFDMDSELAEFGLEESSGDSADEISADFELHGDNGFGVDSDDDLNLASLEADLGELSEVSEEWSADEVILSNELPDLESDFETSSFIEPAHEVPAAVTDVPVMASDDTQDEDLFDQALSDFASESDEINLNDFSSDETALADLTDDEMDAELDFLADADEVATKLDLARAYIDMGDSEGAKDILSEVLGEGNDEQRKEANELLGRIG